MESQDQGRSFDILHDRFTHCILDDDGSSLSNLHDSSLCDSPDSSSVDITNEVGIASPFESSSGPTVRKSDRERRERRTFSPDHHRHTGPLSARGRRRKSTPRKLPKTDRESQLMCELCLSSNMPNASVQQPGVKRPRSSQVWRSKVNKTTGKLMVLCNACGIAYDRPSKVSKAKPRPSPQEKEQYLEEARVFADSLVRELDDPDAERLACPHFKMQGCGCLQRYIIADDNVEESRKRAMYLLTMLKKAKELSQQKFYSQDKTPLEEKNMKKTRSVGLGNGQKRSKEFEEFVMLNRKILRDEVMLCERATQRVLMYSNNFLHKKLKTESRSCRIERTKGKFVLGLLKPIRTLVKEKCCTFRCVRMAVSLSSLLEEWRTRAASGQREARRVIAEMLTPSGGARPNCYSFIEMVTGCSFNTIGKVNEQMRQSGGSREPPTHGMCRYWKNHPMKKRLRQDSMSDDKTGNEGGSQENGEEEMALEEPMADRTTQVQTQNSGGGHLAETGLGVGLHSNLAGDPEAAQSSAEAAQAALSLDPFTSTNEPVADGPEPLVVVDAGLDETDAQPPRPISTADMASHRRQILALQKQLSQQQLQLQQQQQLLQQQMLHQLLVDQVNGTSGVYIQTLQSLQQLLNLQQQYQQQQLVHINQLQEQVGLTPQTDTSLISGQTGHVNGNSELLPLPTMTVPSLLSQLPDTQATAESNQPQQPVVMLQSLTTQQQLLQLQQQKQQQQQQQQQQPVALQGNSSESLLSAGLQVSEIPEDGETRPTVIDDGGHVLAAGDVLDGDAERMTGIESLIQISLPTSSVSSVILPTPALSNSSSSTSRPCPAATTNQPMLQHVIDLGQLGLGLQPVNTSLSQASLVNTSTVMTSSSNGGGILSTSGADASQLLSNLNITLLPTNTTGTNTGNLSLASGNGLASLSSTADSIPSDLTFPTANGSTSVLGATDESLSQLLSSSLGYTVLTIEPHVLGAAAAATTTDTNSSSAHEQDALGQDATAATDEVRIVGPATSNLACVSTPVLEAGAEQGPGPDLCRTELSKTAHSKGQQELQPHMGEHPASSTLYVDLENVIKAGAHRRENEAQELPIDTPDGGVNTDNCALGLQTGEGPVIDQGSVPASRNEEEATELSAEMLQLLAQHGITVVKADG